MVVGARANMDTDRYCNGDRIDKCSDIELEKLKERSLAKRLCFHTTRTTKDRGERDGNRYATRGTGYCRENS